MSYESDRGDFIGAIFVIGLIVVGLFFLIEWFGVEPRYDDATIIGRKFIGGRGACYELRLRVTTVATAPWSPSRKYEGTLCVQPEPYPTIPCQGVGFKDRCDES